MDARQAGQLSPRILSSTIRIVAAMLFACVAATGQVSAQTQPLRIGMSAAVTSMDPHYYNATPNLTVAFHVFESLVAQDGAGKLLPSLAVSWNAIGLSTAFRRVVNLPTSGSPVSSAIGGALQL